jgi:copper chaperone
MCPSDQNRNTSQDREYLVKGMTCGHCVMSVTEEVEQVPGVSGVDVDLQSGRVVVHGAAFSDDAIRDAVDEAGYEVVNS